MPKAEPADTRGDGAEAGTGMALPIARSLDGPILAGAARHLENMKDFSMIDLSNLTLAPEHVTALLRAGGHVLMALLVFFVFIVVGEVVRRVLTRIACHDERRGHLLILAGRFARIVVMLVGAITALGTLGIDVTALVASLGLASFAIGLAFKELLSSVLGGVIIIAHQPFRPGDEITVSGMTGRVITVGLRYTTLSGADGRHLVPNATILSNPVTVAHPTV